LIERQVLFITYIKQTTNLQNSPTDKIDRQDNLIMTDSNSKPSSFDYLFMFIALRHNFSSQAWLQFSSSSAVWTQLIYNIYGLGKRICSNWKFQGCQSAERREK